MGCDMRQTNYPAGMDDSAIGERFGEPEMPVDATCASCRYCAILDGCDDRALVCVKDVLDNVGTPDKATCEALTEDSVPADLWCEQWEAA